MTPGGGNEQQQPEVEVSGGGHSQALALMEPHKENSNEQLL